ncbi:MAG: sugar phosphate nucleotidyltransferase [Armatimonadota bacterium]
MTQPTPQFITHAVIPAAGWGTRLQPLTRIAPKEMLPLGGKPAAQHIIDELKSVGVSDITFVISRNKTSIRDYFGESVCDGSIQLRYVFQEEQRGLGDAILQAEDAINGHPFVVALGDTIIISEKQTQPLARLIEVSLSQNAFAGISVEKVPVTESYRYGMVHQGTRYCEWGFEIDLAIEKPDLDHCPGEYAIGGRYVFDSGIFDLIRRTKPGAGGEQQITDSIMLGISEGRSVWCAPVSDGEFRYDIGNFEVYCEAFAAICLRDKCLSPSIIRAFNAAPETLSPANDPIDCSK